MWVIVSCWGAARQSTQFKSHLALPGFARVRCVNGFLGGTIVQRPHLALLFCAVSSSPTKYQRPHGGADLLFVFFFLRAFLLIIH